MINHEVIVIRKLIPQVSIPISYMSVHYYNFPSFMLFVILHCFIPFLLHSYSRRIIYLSLYLNEYLCSCFSLVCGGIVMPDIFKCSIVSFSLC